MKCVTITAVEKPEEEAPPSPLPLVLAGGAAVAILAAMAYAGRRE